YRGGLSDPPCVHPAPEAWRARAVQGAPRQHLAGAGRGDRAFRHRSDDRLRGGSADLLLLRDPRRGRMEPPLGDRDPRPVGRAVQASLELHGGRPGRRDRPSRDLPPGDERGVTVDGAAAVVTGGTRGLGAAIADALELRGARVARVGRTADRFPADISNPEQVAELAERVSAELGRPSILVNAAGVFGPIESIRTADPDRWIETLLVNAVGPYLTCRAFVGSMVEGGWGRIVNVTSAASLHPPGVLGSAYATAKV